MAAINMPTPQRAGIEAILQGLEAIHGFRGLDTQAQQQKLQDLALQKAQTASQNEQLNNDPASDYSKGKQSSLLAAISIAQKTLGKQMTPEAKQYLDEVKTNLPSYSGAQVDNLSETSPLIKLATTQMQGEASANRMMPLMQVKQAQLDETKNQNASKVGHEFEADPLLKAGKGSLNSLQRSLSILNNPNKPVTTKDLNLAYQDYINAVAAGGAATEGKVHRELPDTFAQTLNDIGSKFGQFDDLRKSPTGAKLVQMLGQNIGTVKNDISNAVEDQAYNIFNNYKDSSNQKVLETAKRKLQMYAPRSFAKEFGGDTPAQPSFTSSLGNSESTSSAIPKGVDPNDWAKLSPAGQQKLMQHLGSQNAQ